MSKVIQLSSHIVWKAISDDSPVTQMKLQKLLYFAQGIYLAKEDTALFPDKVYAWKYGPVVRTVYDIVRKVGNNPMEKELVDIVVGKSFLGLREEISTSDIAFLNEVWSIFGQYSAAELVRITHLPDSPWHKMVEENEEDAKDVVIPQSLMKEYFKKLIQ